MSSESLVSLLVKRSLGSKSYQRELELLCEEKTCKYQLETINCRLPITVRSTFLMAFSPDGKHVASTHGDHRIYICALRTGKLIQTLEGHSRTPW